MSGTPDERPALSAVARLPFVGRRHELARLDARLLRAVAGEGALVVVAGEAGSGKTRIVEALAERARAAGVEVLVGRCYEGEGAPAFFPWLGVLEDYAHHRDRATIRREVGALAPDVVRLSPPLGTALGIAAPPALDDPAEARARIFDGVAAVLARTATSRTLLVILEDVHAADAASRLLLRHVVPALAGRRVLLVATTRDAPTLDAGEAETLVLTGLDLADVERLVAPYAGAEARATAAMVHRRTAGQPLFVTEVVRQWLLDRDLGERLPLTLRLAIARRLAPLSRQALALFRLAAFVGRTVDLGLLARASGADARRFPALLEEGFRAGIVERTHGGQLSFTHALVMESLVESVGALERTRMHQRVAVAASTGPAGMSTAELAHHWYRAGPSGNPAAASRAAERAAEDALAALAYEDAIGWYERALAAHEWEATSDPGREALLRLALADAQRGVGAEADAKASCLRAVAIGRHLGSAEILTRAALAFAPPMALAEAPAPDREVVGLLEEAIAAWDGRESGLHAHALARLAAALFFGVAERRRMLARAGVVMARRVADPATMGHVLARRLYASRLLDDVADRLACARELVQSAETARDLERLAHGRLMLAALLLETGDVGGFADEARRFRELTGQTPRPVRRWCAGMLDAGIATMRGRFAEAEDAAVAASEIGLRALRYPAVAFRAAQLAILRLVQGDPDAAVEYWAPIAAPHPDPRARALLAWAHAAAGRSEEARRLIDGQEPRLYEDGERDVVWLISCGFLAEACVEVRVLPRAAALYGLLAPYESRWVTGIDGAGSLGPVGYLLGRLARVVGRLDAAAEHLERALAGATAAGTPPFEARASIELAAVLRGLRRQRDRSARLAASGRATAERLGMRALLAGP